MNILQLLKEKAETKKGLLVLIAILILTWISGYLLIDLFFTEENLRFTAQLYFSRITLIFGLLFVFSASITHLKNFVASISKTATDLAVFRVLFFGFFAVGLIFNPSIISEQVLPFVKLPESAQVPLPFMSWYPKVIPINETLVRVAIIVFTISIYTSFLGFKTRWSIAIFTITLFYLFAIPNLYGKVNHNHHLIWIPAILAFSPCADRFSLDAYFRKRSNSVMRHNSSAYTMPFLLIWTLIGLIYFFPGFWKLWSNGLDWCFTDNVRNQMYHKWFELGDWSSLLRIDLYPILYKSIGIFTLIFELFFIPLFLNKRTRIFAIFMGISFHFGTLIFMNIFFVVLIWTYLSFINWNKIPFLKDRIKEGNTAVQNYTSKIVKWIGLTLICFSIFFGFGKRYSWPFSIYPTFESIVPEENDQLTFIGVYKLGERIELPVDPLIEEYTSARYWQMQYNIIEAHKNEKRDTLLLNHLIEIYEEDLEELKEVEIYLDRQSIIPGKQSKFKRSLIYKKM
jgi:hypothetical protein